MTVLSSLRRNKLKIDFNLRLWIEPMVLWDTICLTLFLLQWESLNWLYTTYMEEKAIFILLRSQSIVLIFPQRQSEETGAEYFLHSEYIPSLKNLNDYRASRNSKLIILHYTSSLPFTCGFFICFNTCEILTPLTNIERWQLPLASCSSSSWTLAKKYK